jgi:hypothetical protein
LFRVNVAVTIVAVLIVTRQVLPEPVHAPDQPVKVEPVSAMAVSVTEELRLYDAVPVDSDQRITPLSTAIEPKPAPDLATVNVSIVNVADVKSTAFT